jgi:MFS family permease
LLITGLAAVLAAALAWAVLHPVAPPAQTGARRHPLDFRAVFANRRALLFILIGGGHSYEFAVMRNWMTAFLAFGLVWHGAGSLAGLGAASIAALTTFMVLPASMAGGELARRFGQRNLIVGAMLVSFVVACLAGLAMSVSIWLAVLFVFLHTFTVALDQGALSGAAIAAAKPAELGQVMALLSMVNYMGVAAGPIVTGLLFDALSGPAAPWVWGVGYALAGFLPLVGGVALLVATRHERSRPA